MGFVEIVSLLIANAPAIIRAGIDIKDDIVRLIGKAPAQDQPALLAKWQAKASDVDAADADWEAMKREKGFT